MNKTEFIAAVAEKAGMTKADAQRAVNAYAEVVRNAMLKEDKVTILGFGTFSVTERKAREGVNPQTGAKLQIAARKAVKFKPGSMLDMSAAAAPKKGKKK